MTSRIRILVLGLLVMLAGQVPVSAQGRPDVIWARAGWSSSSHGTPVAVSPDGSRIAVIASAQVRILRATDGTVLRSFVTGDTSISARVNLEWVGTDQVAVYAEATGTGSISVWRTTDGTLVRRLPPLSHGVNQIAVSPDGGRLATALGLTDQNVSGAIWDVSTGNLVAQLPARCGLGGIGFSFDGNTVATFCRSTLSQYFLTFFRSSDGTEISRRSTESRVVGPLRYSPDSSHVAVMASGGVSWEVIRASDGAVTSTASAPQGMQTLAWFGVEYLAGGTVSTAEDVPTARVWRVSDGTEVRSFAVGRPGSGVDIAVHGSTLFTSSLTLRRWSNVIDGPTSVVLSGHNGSSQAVSSLQWTDDGARLVSTIFESQPGQPQQHEIRVWNATNGALLRVIDNGSGVQAAALLPSTPLVATVSRNDRTIKIFDIDTGSVVRVVNIAGLPFGLAVNPSGTLLAINYFRGPIELRSTADLSVVRTLNGDVTRVTFSPDGLLLAGAAEGGGAGTLIVWSVDGTQRYARQIGDASWLATNVAFSRDGNVIAVTGSTGGTPVGGPVGGGGWLRLFRASDGALLSGRNGSAQQLGATFHTSGTLTTWGFDGLTVWDAQSVTEQRFTEEVGRFTASGPLHLSFAAFSPDSARRRLAYGLYDGSVVVADLPDEKTCTPTVRSSANSFSANGGSATVSITFPNGASSCAWQAQAIDPWITIAPAAGTGDATLTLAVAANESTSGRAGVIDLAGTRLSVAQAGTLCVYDITAPTAALQPGVETVSFSITTGPSCRWAVRSPVDWAVARHPFVEFNTFAGSGTARLSIAANLSGQDRSATFVIAGRPFTVTQAGACTYALSASSATALAAGSSGQVSLTTGSVCGWNASSQATWLTVAPPNGTGSGALTWTTTANTGAMRTGTLSIAGQTFTVTQDGAPAPCSFTLSPTSASVAAAGGTGNVTVTASASSCTRAATSDASWLTITAGANGTGTGTVGYTVAANTATISRTGTLTIGGQIFSVTQDPASASCSFALSPTSVTVGAVGASGSVAVMASDSSCTWTAASNHSFLTITGGASGTGNGTVSYTVAGNTATASRTGTLTIAGHVFTVAQSGTTPCAYAVTPTAVNAAAAGATGALTVTTSPQTCTWAATSMAAFVTVTSGASGTGNGSVSYRVAANATSTSRTTTIAIADQTVTLTQAGVSATTPSNLAVQVAGSRLTFTWDAPSGVSVSTYQLEAGTASGLANLASFATGTNDTTFSADNVPPGTYYFRVRAITASGVSGPSNEVSATVRGPMPPGAPSELQATVSGSGVTLTWAAPTSGGTPTTYILDVGNSAGLSNLASFATGSTQTSFIAPAVPNGTYYGRVRAANAVGASGPSNEVTFTVGPAPCMSAPGAPTGFQSSVLGRQLTLTWNVPSGSNAPTAYQLEAGSATGLSNLASFNTGSTVTSFTASAPPGTFFLRVRAINACGMSAASADVAVTIP